MDNDDKRKAPPPGPKSPKPGQDAFSLSMDSAESTPAVRPGVVRVEGAAPRGKPPGRTVSSTIRNEAPIRTSIEKNDAMEPPPL